MTAAFALGAAALNQIQNIGQIGEIVQGQVHQREQISWTRRGYLLDSQSLRLDALDHAKEELKSHYDTYVSRIDTLLLVLALIWPFALNLVQFSDEFVPGMNCSNFCVEEDYPLLIWVWVFLIAVILILPFWGILMLIRCKLKLDSWLEYSLAGLNQKRRAIVEASHDNKCSHSPVQSLHHASLFTMENSAETKLERENHEETEKIVHQLVTIVLGYQEYLAGIWNAECGWLVHSSTFLLWMSVVAALLLTSISIWIFLVNEGGAHAASSNFFATLIILGATGPGVYVISERGRGQVPPPVFDEDGLSEDPFPLSSARLLRSPSLKDVPSLHSACSGRGQPAPAANGWHKVAAPKSSFRSFWQCQRRKQNEEALRKPLLVES